MLLWGGVIRAVGSKFEVGRLMDWGGGGGTAEGTGITS